MSSANSELHPDETLKLGKLGPQVFRISFLTGLIFLIATLTLGLVQGDGMQRFFFSYLLGFAYFLSLALGALFFSVLHHLVRAKWSVVVRRLSEAMMGTFPLLLGLFLVILLPMLLGHEGLYVWSDPEYVHEHHLIHEKQGYLNVPFFVIRCLIYFGVWIAVSKYFFDRSTAQDETGDPRLTDKMRFASGPAVIAFALTTAWAAFDLLMSLQPAWFSTIFGVYFFAGAMISVMATLALVSMGLQRKGILTRSITTEHYHDIGKLLFAWVFFWGYIAFSQFMLIWYGNIPEETYWFDIRVEGEWLWVTLVLLFFHLLFPFVCLLSRHTKRRKPTLAFFAAWMLLLHWVDLYWLILPAYDAGGVPLNIMDITATVGIGGLFVAVATHLASRVNLVPTGDPALGESLSFENV